MTSETALTQPDASFFKPGGTLPGDAACYVTRNADSQLVQALARGEFCYVLTSRQMGKSSLMVRTAHHLRAQGMAVAVLDLTRYGSNLTPEQWYYVLLLRLGEELKLEEQMEDFWDEHTRLSPLARLLGALREVVLERLSSQVVIFVDEIDVVRSLPFNTDEFFVAIRELYNRRTQDPQLNRLTFCLLGVASPADLIQDTRITPFNIGIRIELADFTPQEAAPLARGLSVLTAEESGIGSAGETLLSRVLYWTGGHPYLTQRLCLALVETLSSPTSNAQRPTPNVPPPPTPTLVDRLCQERFFDSRVRETESNLQFVSDRLLRSGEDINALLNLYGKVLSGQRIADDETDPLVTTLKLSGIVRVEKGILKVRNRIYGRVFDKAWIVQHTEASEIRRQREAKRRGRNRVLAIASVILIVSGLAVTNYRSARHAALARDNALVREREAVATRQRADANAREALQQKRIAQREAGLAEHAQAAALHLAAQRKTAMDALGKETQRANRALQSASEERIKAVRQAGLAERARAAESAARQDALVNAALARRSAAEARINAANAGHYLYVADMNLIQSRWEENSVGGVLQLLEETRASPERGFEWGYWNRLCHLDLLTLKGHTQPVTSVCFSPNGTRILTGSSDGTAKLWEVASGRELFTLREHTNGATSACFSPDGKHILTGSDDSTAKVWDAATGRELLTLEGHSGSVTSVCFSPDGKRILTGSGDTAKVWEAATGRELLTLKGHTSYVTSVCFSPDGKRILTGSFDSTAKVWEATTGRELLTLKGHTGPVYSACFSPDGRRILTGSADNTAKVWEATTGRELLTLKGHTGGVNSACFSPDGKRILTGSSDNTAKVWDTDTGKELLTLKGHTRAVLSACFSPDGKRILTGSDDSTAKVWDATTGKDLLTLKGHANGVSSVCFSPDGKHILTGSGDGTAKVWEAATGQELFTLKGHTGPVTSVCFSPNGKRIFIGGGDIDSEADADDVTAQVWDVATSRELLTLKGPAKQVTSVCFSPDGKRILTGIRDGTAKVWDATTGRELLTLKRYTYIVTSVCFSPDGKRILTGSGDIAKVWDAATGRELFSLHGHIYIVNSVCFSPDGKRILTGSDDSTARVWEVSTGRELLTLKGHAGQVNSVCFSPDGKRILTGSRDKTAKVWEAATGRELLTLKGHTSSISSVCFSPDGKRILTGSADGTAKVWFGQE